jgi:serine/threonine protein kinase
MFGNRQAVYTEEYNKSKVSLNKNLYEANELSQIKVNNEIEISRDKVEVLSVLGIGEFGALYDAEVQLTPNVKSRALIKVFEQGSSQDLVIYKQECESLLNLRHKNVVQLFGFVSSPPYFTVLELPINGDLKTFLLTVKELQTELTMPQLLAMATDAASGLSYLESIDYIHNDIAARNCVVTQSLGIKIADYKVGRYLFRSEYAVQADGSLMPVRWMAPESLMENHFSLQSDVWSFGILMWEILTVGEFPYAELSDGEVVQSICYEFQRLMQPVSCPDST